jgi:hypothetical protein
MSREWVEERCITCVEVEIEGERWVTDLFYEDGEESGSGNTTADSNGKGSSPKKLRRKKGAGSQDLEREVLVKTWSQHKPSRKGEWRRRRWVRGVERVPSISEDP